MARQATRSGKSGRGASKSSRSGGNGRSASEKTEKYRFAQNVGGEETAAEREYRTYALGDGENPGDHPDVLLDVPVVKVDSIHLELEDLDAHVALKAKVLDLVKLNVGVDVHLGHLRLDIKGVEAQALLKVRLDRVAAIVDRVLTTIDRNPDLVKSIGKAVEDVGSGAGKTLDKTGEAVGDVGEGAEGAVQEVGQGAGQAVGELGQGAGQAAGEVGEGAGQAVGQVGEGAGQAAGQAGQAAGQAAGDVGQAADQAAGQAGQAAGDVAGGAAGDPAQAGGSEPAKAAEKHDATDAATKAAKDLGVDLGSLDGSGAKGRITVKDVRKAQKA